MASFSLYVPVESPLHRLHPLTKLTGMGCAIALIFLPNGNWLTTEVFLWLLLLGLWGHVLGPLLRSLLPLLLPLALLLVLVHGFFSPLGHTPLWAIGGLTLTQEGLQYAGILLLRLAALAAAPLLLLLTTRPADLVHALAQKGLPPALTYIFLSTVQLIPQGRARIEQILAAQQARGLRIDGSPTQRVRALLPLVVPLVNSLLMDADERAMLLEARAFRSDRPRTHLVHLPDPPSQHYLRWALLTLTVMLNVWSYAKS